MSNGISWFQQHRVVLAVALGLGLSPALIAARPLPPALIQPAMPDLAAQIDTLLDAGELSPAASLIEHSVGVLPPSRLMLARGDYALANGDTAAALAIYKQLVTDPPVAARAQLGTGLAELRNDHSEAALAAFETAVTADPSLTRAWIACGVAADRLRDWTHADNAYARALDLEPKSAAALTNRGYSRLLRGRFTEAAADSALALAIDPKLVTASNNLRLARAMQGDYKTAFAGSTKLSMANDLNTVGFAAMSRGDYGLAETFFTHAMQLNPQFDRTAWSNLIFLKQLAHQPVETKAAER